MLPLTFPFTEEKIRALKVGDEVSISGTLFTGRDAVHKYLHEGGKLPAGVNLKDGILYHCGPVVIKDEQGNWKCVAAGPTTSIREEPYQGQIIREFGVRGVIGKGGMGDRTLQACRESGCVYDCRWRMLNAESMKRSWCLGDRVLVSGDAPSRTTSSPSLKTKVPSA